MKDVEEVNEEWIKNMDNNDDDVPPQKLKPQEVPSKNINSMESEFDKATQILDRQLAKTGKPSSNFY